MRFFFATIICRLKMSLTKSFFAALFLFFITLFFVALSFGGQQKIKMNIGIYYEPNAFSERLADRFMEFSKREINTMVYTDKELMLKDVENNRLECAYELPQSYQKDYAGIKLYVSPNTVGEEITKVLLAANYIENMAGDLGYKVLRNQLSGDKKEIQVEITAKNAEYLSKGSFMEVDYKTMKSGQAAESGNSLYYAVSGTIALFSALITMLWCVGLVRDTNGLMFKRLKMTGASIPAYFSGNAAAIFILNLLFFTVAKVISAMFFGIRFEIIITVCYAVFISALGTGLAALIKKESIFLGFTIVGFLGLVVCGGIYIDIGEFIPALDRVKYIFFTNFYMDAIRDM